MVESQILSIIDLRINDFDRYLLSLFVKSYSQRKSIITLDFFHLELAQIRDVIETPHMGFIRLQWWRDEISKIYQGKGYASHPVLLGLAGILDTYQITMPMIDKMIAGREADFEDYDTFDIYKYAHGIHAPLLSIKAKILNETEDTDSLAEAYALIGLLRAIPFYRARSQVLIPSIQPEAVQKICNTAEELLEQDKTKHRYFKAHHVLARLYLKQLKNIGYQPEKLKPLPFKELRVWWGVWRGV